MQTYPNVISRTTKSVDWLFDRELESADNAACAEQDRRADIERKVSFADVLEEMVEFTQPQQEEFMRALHRARDMDKHTMYLLVDQAMERLVERRLADAAETAGSK